MVDGYQLRKDTTITTSLGTRLIGGMGNVKLNTAYNTFTHWYNDNSLTDVDSMTSPIGSHAKPALPPQIVIGLGDYKETFRITVLIVRVKIPLIQNILSCITYLSI